MKRLTDGRIYTFEGKKVEKVENDYIMNIQKRLSEYEDLEIAPEQVREMSHLYQQKCEEVARLEKRLEELDYIEYGCTSCIFDDERTEYEYPCNECNRMKEDMYSRKVE